MHEGAVTERFLACTYISGTFKHRFSTAADSTNQAASAHCRGVRLVFRNCANNHFHQARPEAQLWGAKKTSSAGWND